MALHPMMLPGPPGGDGDVMTDNTRMHLTAILQFLESHRWRLAIAMRTARCGLRVGGKSGPRGFQAETKADEAVWVNGDTDADFLLPKLRTYFDELRLLGVTNLPEWTGEPRDETKAFELLDGLIGACRAVGKNNESSSAPVAKGEPGRRGYPLEALHYAMELRNQKPKMKAIAIRAECLKRFSEDDLPISEDAFRRWLNRKRKNGRIGRID
jgi:hypothetical protein